MRKPWGLALLAALCLAGPARAQINDLREVLSGRNYPLTLKLGDLNEDWRRFSMQPPESSGWSFYAPAAALRLESRYYTRGQTVRVGGETFVVAYRASTRPFNLAEVLQRPDQAPEPVALTPETPLRLSLLNLRMVGSFHEVQPFDLKAETAESVARESGTAGEAERSRNNLKQLGTALLMYVQDYDEKLPPMEETRTTKNLLMPYSRNESVFVQPSSREFYRSNPILSRRKMAHILSPATMVAFYEGSPAADGSRNVVYLDGHVAAVSAADWPRVMQASKIREAANPPPGAAAPTGAPP